MKPHERGHVPANNQRLFRQTIENEIERLIALLDNVDGDCDYEDDRADLEDGCDAEPQEFASW